MDLAVCRIVGLVAEPEQEKSNDEGAYDVVYQDFYSPRAPVAKVRADDEQVFFVVEIRRKYPGAGKKVSRAHLLRILAGLHRSWFVLSVLGVHVRFRVADKNWDRLELAAVHDLCRT